MNAIEYLKEKGRMTGNCKDIYKCRACKLSEDINDTEQSCGTFECLQPEQAVEIVEKWAKENPPKTYLSALLERLPNAKLNEKGLPTCICPNMIFKVENGCRKGQFMTCLECWNREYKEED